MSGNRIGTGLGSRVRSYVVTVSTTFRQLEQAVTENSEAPAMGSVIVLSATKSVRTLDSAYVQGVLIYNPSATANLLVAGLDYVGKTVGGAPDPAATAWIIPPGQYQRFDCRDATGIAIACSAGTVNARVVGN